MKTVTQKTFTKRTTETFVWEVVWEPNGFGQATVRDTRSGRQFSVQVK